MPCNLDTSVISTAGKLAGRDCSGIPFSLSDELLMKRELLWKEMLEKYKLLEENTLNNVSIRVDMLGDRYTETLSAPDEEVVPQSTIIKFSDADESWEERQKYRKPMDSVQHWVNTTLPGPFSEPSDCISHVPSEEMGFDLPASGTESLCNSLFDINSCVWEHQSNCEEHTTSKKSVLKESNNVDSMSVLSKEDQTLDKLSQAVLIIQEQPKKRKKLVEQSLEDCSMNPESESKTLITINKRSRSIEDSNLIGNFISCNKSPVSRNRNVMIKTDKDNLLPKIILIKCDKIPVLTNGEDQHSDKNICAPRKKERILENCNSSAALTKEEHSVGYIRCTRNQMFKNCDKGPTATQMAYVATDTEGDCQKNLTSGRESSLSTGKEVSKLKKEISREDSYHLSMRKANLSIVKDVPVCRKETLMENDTRTRSNQKPFSDAEKSKENCNMNPVLVMENPVFGFGLEKNTGSCDTDTLRRMFFSDKEASTSRREINIEQCDKGKKSLQFSNISTLTSGTGRNAEKSSKCQTPRNGKLVPSISDATVSVTEKYVENYYTRPFIRKDEGLVSRTEDNLGDCGDSPVLRKNKLFTTDKHVLMSTTEEILKHVNHSILSREEQLSDEDEESLEAIRAQILENGKKDQTSGIEALANDRVPVARPVCHRNPTSAREQHCEQHETSKREVLQTPKPRERCIQIKGQENLASEYADIHTSEEDSFMHSLEDASTIIINPLFSCRFEHLIPEIRKKLENLHEDAKKKDKGGPHFTHDNGSTGHNYNCSERRVLQQKKESLFTERLNNRHTLNLDASHHHDSHVSETQGQSRDDKSSELSGNKQERKGHARSENRKDVLQCTLLQSEKEEIINNSCDKIGSSGSQNMSVTNKSNKESPKHSSKSLRFGTNNMKHNHCNSDDEGHGFQMNGKRETDALVFSEHDESKAEILDDDDDIFFRRTLPHSRLHNEKERKIINKRTFSLDARKMSPRGASDNKISGLSVNSELCRNVKTVFRGVTSNSATVTYPSAELQRDKIANIITDDGENQERRRREISRSSHHSTGSGCAKYEDDKASDGKNTRKEFVLTERKRKLETSNHLTESSYSKNYGENPTKGNVLTRVKSGTATSNQICSEHGENRDIADMHILSDGNGGGGSLEKETVSPKWKWGTKLSNHLLGSDNDKTEYHIRQDDEDSNKRNVLTRRKRGMKASNNSVGSKHVENENDITNNGENPKKRSVFHKKERQTKTSSHYTGSEPDRNEDVTRDVLVLNDQDNTSENESVFTGGRRRTGRPNHYVNEDYDVFYKTHKHSLFYEKGKDIYKEYVTTPKLSQTNKIKSFKNNSSQSMLNRNSISKDAVKCLVKPTVLENESTAQESRSYESAIGTENLLIDSYRQNFSEDVLEKGASSDKSDDNIHRLKMECNLKSRTAETRSVPSAGSDHLKSERELSDDDIFYKTPKHSLFCEKGNFSSQKSSKTNKYKSFKNNSTQSISKEALKCLVKPTVLEKESITQKESRRYESSVGTGNLFTDSYRKNFSGDIMEKGASSDKSDDNIRLKMESKLESRSTETWKDHLPSSGHHEKEQVMGHDHYHDDDDNDDIFYYRKYKQSSCYEKEKNRQHLS